MNYYKEIKNQFINNEVTKRVKDFSKNKSDLDTYYNVGKLLVEAQGGEERAKYGDGLIKEYSKKISQMEEDLKKKEQALYSKWASVETAMNKLNSQLSNLQSYFA